MHICEWENCGKKFPTSQLLSQHQFQHKIKIYQCSECKFSSKIKDKFIEHIRDEHLPHFSETFEEIKTPIQPINHIRKHHGRPKVRIDLK